jgi:hypothetical protein
MNWPAIFFSVLAGMAFWYSGYLFGLKVGHLRGHRCEAIYQQIYDSLPVKDNNDTP